MPRLAAVKSAICSIFEPSLRIVTAGLVFQARKSIDHVALGADWAVDSVDAISNVHGERKRSDHFGVAADVSVRSL